jgi:hypothetical protein
MVGLAIELGQLRTEAPLSRMTSSQRTRISSVNGPRRYFGVKTK